MMWTGMVSVVASTLGAAFSTTVNDDTALDQKSAAYTSFRPSKSLLRKVYYMVSLVAFSSRLVLVMLTNGFSNVAVLPMAYCE